MSGIANMVFANRIPPVVGGGGGATDPYWSNVVMLINGGQANNSTTIVDSATGALSPSVNSNVKYSTAQSKFAGSSLVFSSARLQYANNTKLQCGTGDYTWELWLYPNTTSGFQGIITGFLFTRLLWSISSGAYYFESGTGDTPYGGTRQYVYQKNLAGAVTANAWQHLAVSKQGTTWRFYKNGSLVDTATGNANTPESVNPTEIGSFNGNGNYFSGYMEGIRLTKGVARYTGSTYTVPTASFPTS